MICGCMGKRQKGAEVGREVCSGRSGFNLKVQSDKDVKEVDVEYIQHHITWLAVMGGYKQLCAFASLR